VHWMANLTLVLSGYSDNIHYSLTQDQCAVNHDTCPGTSKIGGSAKLLTMFNVFTASFAITGYRHTAQSCRGGHGSPGMRTQRNGRRPTAE
jgi:hypothetical protein